MGRRIVVRSQGSGHPTQMPTLRKTKSSRLIVHAVLGDLPASVDRVPVVAEVPVKRWVNGSPSRQSFLSPLPMLIS